jgi:hypothetical protein
LRRIFIGTLLFGITVSENRARPKIRRQCDARCQPPAGQMKFLPHACAFLHGGHIVGIGVAANKSRQRVAVCHRPAIKFLQMQHNCNMMPDQADYRVFDENSETLFVKPQRIFSHLAFALFLLLSQQLGIAHAISHFSSDRISRSTHEKPLPAEMHCSQCLAFAAIGSALNSASATFATVLPVSWLPIAPPIARPIPFTHRAYHSRAPPVTL